MTGGRGGSGVGAVLGEIPLFGPGAGSAASAGMTELGRGNGGGWGCGYGVPECAVCGGWGWLGALGGEGGWAWAPNQVWGDGSGGRASEDTRGRFPLGGGNDEEKGGGYDGEGGSARVGGVCVEIPAASAGMTDLRAQV